MGCVNWLFILLEFDDFYLNFYRILGELFKIFFWMVFNVVNISFFWVVESGVDEKRVGLIIFFSILNCFLFCGFLGFIV